MVTTLNLPFSKWGSRGIFLSLNPASLRSWDNSTNKLQFTLFLKLESHYTAQDK